MVMELINTEGTASTQQIIQRVRPDHIVVASAVSALLCLGDTCSFVFPYQQVVHALVLLPVERAQHGQGITRVLDCPKHMVGRIIGKGGETVKGMQKQFATSIQIEQNGNPCKVTITGPPHAVDGAER